MRNRRMKGIALISLGVGILLALVLPVGCTVAVCAITLIALGICCCKKK